MKSQGRYTLNTKAGFGTYVAIIVVMLVVLFPVYWLVVTSIRPNHQLLSSSPSLWIRQPVLDHYRALFRGSQFPRYLLNSIYVSVVATVFSTVISTLAAYSITRLRYRFRGLISKIILLSYMFPGVLLMVPLYMFLSNLGLLDSLFGLIIVYVTWCAPFSTWILISFFKSVPADLEEAAMMDGASRLQALIKVLLPLSLPGMVTSMIFGFVSAWNEYPLAVILLSSESNKTLPVGLSAWMQLYSIEWGSMAAGGVITILPIMVIFILMGKSFVAGMTEGGVKG